MSNRKVDLDDAINVLFVNHYIVFAPHRNDAFEQFFEKQKGNLLVIVKQAMDKTVDRGISTENIKESEYEAELMTTAE